MNASNWGAAVPAEADFAATLPHAEPQALEVRFTGSGSEYFRIWIVNLLLTVVTLTLYYPWAKVRRLRYFHGNTIVGGHALDFHGDPKKMLRGYLLVGVMVLLYSVADYFSSVAGVAAFLIVTALWPALLKSSLQFRMANTSWRGLRFRFTGSLGGAYGAFLPLFVPGLLVVAASLFVEDELQPPAWYGAYVLGVMAFVMVLVPWLWWNLKKYQHDHYAFGGQRSTLSAGAGSFYGVFLKTIGVTLLSALVAGAVIGVVMVAGLAGVALGGDAPGKGPIAAIIMGLVFAFVMMLVVQLLPRPYFVSRLQNLLWSRTGSQALQFHSALRFVPLLALTLKNWILVVLTLGLYWPFAAVATARMRLEAVSVTATEDLDRLVQEGGADGDAAGDAAGDLFGIDVGL